LLRYHSYTLHTADSELKLQTARRVFGLVPLLVFLIMLVLLAGQVGHTIYEFAQLMVRVLATSLASSLVCVAAYGFYRYLCDRSHGL
jgi:hypothetical protein